MGQAAEEHPEVPPINTQPMQSFLFDASGIKDSKKEIELQSEAFDERITRISQKFTLGEMQVIPQILTISRDPEELRGLSKGLLRIADIVAKADELRKRATVLEVAEDDPNWVAWAFGDFEVSDIAIEDFLSGEVDGDSSEKETS